MPQPVWLPSLVPLPWIYFCEEGFILQGSDVACPTVVPVVLLYWVPEQHHSAQLHHVSR